MKEYMITRLTFGVSCSSFAAYMSAIGMLQLENVVSHHTFEITDKK